MRKRKRKKKNHKQKYQQTERVKERKKEKENQSKREYEDTRREEKIKTIIYQKYVYRGDKKIKKMKK